jgi:transposase-like protein
MRQLRLRASPRGESVAAFARRHGVSARDVAAWNRELQPQGRLRPGQVVVVMREAPPVRVATKGLRGQGPAKAQARSTSRTKAAAKAGAATRPAARAATKAAPRKAARPAQAAPR